MGDNVVSLKAEMITGVNMCNTKNITVYLVLSTVLYYSYTYTG